VTSLSVTDRDLDSPNQQKMAASEILLLCFSLLSLVVSCILWSPHKQAWMDEIFTWKEVSDPSLWHLYYAIQHGADGGMPLFYTTAWLWAKAFGTGVLTLRLYSCVAMCAALVVTWRTIRRFYGIWATAFGVLTFWGFSGLLLYQNVEARFYGLFMLTVAITVDIYTRLVAQPAPKPRLLVLSLAAQAALVLTHTLGIIYGGLILLALVLSDAAKRRFRLKIYLFHMAGWLALLVWVPGIRTSMAAGKPHGWILMPTVKAFFSAYQFEGFDQWIWFVLRHSNEATFQLVRHAVELVILIPLALVLLFGLPRLVASRARTGSDPRSAFLLAAYLLLSMPVVLFALSHLVTPVFVPRYLLPCGIGVAILLANFADALGSDSPASPRLVWRAAALFLAISPVLSVLALPPLVLSKQYLDVQRLDRDAPANIPVVAGWQEDFSKIMRFSSLQPRYYFLLDWPSALAGPSEFVLDYHLMKAYRDSGYYSQNIQDSHVFLCSHPDFFVLDVEGHSWFDMSIKTMPQFEWKIIDSFSAPDLPRNLIAVHRRASLAFCNQPQSLVSGLSQ
jgi:Dolichyl-phosphate-mannose-protein mannosyltransferase